MAEREICKLYRNSCSSCASKSTFDALFHCLHHCQQSHFTVGNLSSAKAQHWIHPSSVCFEYITGLYKLPHGAQKAHEHRDRRLSPRSSTIFMHCVCVMFCKYFASFIMQVCQNKIIPYFQKCHNLWHLHAMRLPVYRVTFDSSWLQFLMTSHTIVNVRNFTQYTKLGWNNNSKKKKFGFYILIYIWANYSHWNNNTLERKKFFFLGVSSSMSCNIKEWTRTEKNI